MPRRTAKEWDAQVLHLETELHSCEAALARTRQERDQALAVLHDASEEGGARARVVALEQALWALANMVTGKGSDRGSVSNGMNPYGRPEVRAAYTLLTGNPYGDRETEQTEGRFTP